MVSGTVDRHKRIAAAEGDKEARAVAAKLGIFFRYSKAVFAGVRTAHYSIMRGQWKIADYWPSNGHLLIGGKHHAATSLADALTIAANSAELADASKGRDTQPALPVESVAKQRPQKRKTHRPKNPTHMARGAPVPKIKPALILKSDDCRRIEVLLMAAAAADERNSPNMLSLNRELLERIRDALCEGCNIILKGWQ